MSEQGTPLDIAWGGPVGAADFVASRPEHVDRLAVTKLTSAQVLALFSTPVQCSPTVGQMPQVNFPNLQGNYDILLMGAEFWTLPPASSPTAYTSLHNLAISYGPSGSLSSPLLEVASTGLLDQTVAAKKVAAPYYVASGDGTLTLVAGQPLFLSILTGNPATGNLGLEVRIRFRLSPAAATPPA